MTQNDQKPKKPKKPQAYLSPEESEITKPVRWPWFWVGLLIFVILISVWRDYNITRTVEAQRKVAAQQAAERPEQKP